MSSSSLPVKSIQLQGQVVLWQEPDAKPEGILFVAHGCSHSNTDWFVDCKVHNESCIGLPEELGIVQLAHKPPFHLVVVAVSSTNRKSKCWEQRDGPVVAEILRFFQRQYPDIPVIAFGASSGGAFVSAILPLHFEGLRGYIAQIAPPPRTGVSTSSTIPGVFITMSRDQHITRLVKHYVSNHSKKSHRHIQLNPLALTPTFFHDRIPRLYTPSQSAAMVRALVQADLLDQDGLLRYDPRRSGWRPVLRRYAQSDAMIPDASPVSEVLNVAWGEHELSRDGVAEALQFLLKSGGVQRSLY